MDHSLIVVFFLSVIGSVVQTTAGFGCGIIIMLVLPSVLPLLQASAVSAATCSVLVISVAVRYRRYISLRKLVLPCILYVSASSIIIRISSVLNLRALVLSFGAFLVLLALYFFCGGKRASFPDSKIWAIICFVVSGITSGLFGIGGPLLAAYYLKNTDSKEEYTATLQALFSISTVWSTLMRISKGIYTVSLLPITLCGIIGVVIGNAIGQRIYQRVNIAALSKIVYSFIGICGVLTIISNLP